MNNWLASTITFAVITPGTGTIESPVLCASFTDLLSIAIKQVADKDPEWLMFLIQQNKGLARACIQHQLSFGLAHLRSLAEARTYKARQELLADSSNREFNNRFLYEALREVAQEHNLTGLLNYDTDDEWKYIERPLIPDSDTGPEEVWHWAHRYENRNNFVFGNGQIPLRKWAYVMWDQQRLDSWGIFG